MNDRNYSQDLESDDEELVMQEENDMENSQLSEKGEENDKRPDKSIPIEENTKIQSEVSKLLSSVWPRSPFSPANCSDNTDEEMKRLKRIFGVTDESMSEEERSEEIQDVGHQEKEEQRAENGHVLAEKDENEIEEENEIEASYRDWETDRKSVV